MTLIENGLRERVILRVDGGLKSGVDVLMAAAMGADEYGCVMARICHTNNCPVGVASQEAGCNVEEAQRGIVYIDEVDKMTMKSHSSNGGRDVSGADSEFIADVCGYDKDLCLIACACCILVCISRSSKNGGDQTLSMKQ